MTESYSSLIDLYIDTYGGSEPPECFQRWSFITGLSSILGRRVFFQHGAFNLYPTIYAILIGIPGTRKSTAIKQLKKLVQQAGYDRFAADKTTKEKFLVDLDGTHEDQEEAEKKDKTNICLDNLFNGSDHPGNDDRNREIFICSDEFYDFIGSQNIDFISLLGNLWDYTGIFEYKIRHGKKVVIPEPTVSLLGGCTFETFSMAFPAAVLGQGFLSRLLMVYSEPTGRKITWPTPPDGDKLGVLASAISIPLNLLKHESLQLFPSADAMTVLDELYREWEDLKDPRLRNYSNRRFSHLLKVAQVCFIARALLHFPDKIVPSSSLSVEAVDVIAANTYLSAIEQNMPKALGEFGRSKHSAVQQTILEYMRGLSGPCDGRDLWKVVSRDLDDTKQLPPILQGMQAADLIYYVHDQGWYAVARKSQFEKHVNLDLLSDSEKRMI